VEIGLEKDLNVLKHVNPLNVLKHVSAEGAQFPGQHALEDEQGLKQISGFRIWSAGLDDGWCESPRHAQCQRLP
jgi:hypothetical protein